MTPEMGGASEAMANPSPKGRATRDTTNPAKRFLGRSPINIVIVLGLFIFLVLND
jgi:hypothetical protein